MQLNIEPRVQAVDLASFRNLQRCSFLHVDLVLDNEADRIWIFGVCEAGVQSRMFPALQVPRIG